jgi:acylphosphatase
VRNRPDGSVEAWLEGAPDAVEALLAWMRRGPAGARVTDITVTETLPQNDADFVVTD